jgi:6-phosphogluconolactonase (cycloisomerase 2 family)
MKFTKFGKALLISALSVGVVLGVSSCITSYTVGFLYVTGTVTAENTNLGIVSGYKIDHDTGRLQRINGLPVSSGGANPVRAVLTSGSRFLYVLNRGINAQGGADCTADNPCQNSNITAFAVGGNGILTPQMTFYPVGINPIRLIGDTSGNYVLALDQEAPSSAACQLALGPSVKTCGDVEVWKIDQNTGRLSLILNAQVTAANGKPLPYFPVPANPIDFVLAPGYVLTLSGTPESGDVVFPYTYTASSGQLTLNQNGAQPLGIKQGTAIVNAASVIYVLDNEAPDPNPTSAASQILPFTVGTNGSLQAETGGIVPDTPTQANPIYLMVEEKGKFLYVANQGNNVLGQNAQSGIAGYFIVSSPSYQLQPTAPADFGTGAGPQCIVEDPSGQYIYTANFNDSSITGRVVDPNSGVLNNLRVASTYAVNGPPTWCLVDGRTD